MLEVRSLSLRLGETIVLDNVTLSLPEGEMTAVCGPNGAGKSSLLSVLAGDRQPSQGTALCDGLPMAQYPANALAARRAVLEQSPKLDAPFSVRDLTEFGLASMPALAPSEVTAIVDRALSMAGVAHLSQRTVNTLSGGERHRAHLARVLAQTAGGRALGHGRHLLLDEPTASLDLRHQIGILRAVQALTDIGTGVLIVLHDLNLAAAFCDRVILLGQGRVVADGAPEDVLTSEGLSTLFEAPIAVSHAPGRALRVTPDLSSRAVCRRTPNAAARGRSATAT